MVTLRVGIAGLGQVAQIMHLPVLRSLRHLYEVVAICDVSAELRGRVGDEYSIPRRYPTVYDLLEREKPDVLFVLTPDETHSEITVTALEAGVHVFVEKPMCLCIREANDILAAQKRSGRQVMVGYMRRYASAFIEAKKLLDTYSCVNYARARGIIGENHMVIDQATAVVSADLPSETLAESRTRRRNLILEAVGDLPDKYVRAYRELCGLGCHDLSALRELLGPPRDVIAARTWNDGRFITALLDYGDFVASYEGGTDAQLRFDAHLEVQSESGSFTLRYDTPYIRHLPTELHTWETRYPSLRRSTLRPTLKDPFTEELEYLHRVICSGNEPKTSPDDFIADLELFRAIIIAAAQE